MPQSRFLTLLGYVTPYKATLLFASALMLGESAASLITPWLAGHFTNALLGQNASQISDFKTILMLWLALLAVQALLRFGNSYLLASTGARMLARLRTRLYDHLQSLPVSYYHHQRRGEILSLLARDAGILSHFVTSTLVSLLPLVLTFLGALVLMFRIDAQIALLAALLVPLFILVIKLLGHRLRPLSTQLSHAHASTLAQVEENLNLLPIIKAFTREADESSRYRDQHQHLLQLTTQHLRLQSLLSPCIHFLTGSAIVLLLWLSSQRLVAGALTPAEIVSLLLYGLLLARPVSSLASLYGQIQSTRGAAERLIDVFSIEPEPNDKEKPDLPPIQSEIQLQNIHFHYFERGKIFEGLNLTIQAGETLAITGANGSGKSTLVHLLMRFADPQEGAILIDGIDIRERSIQSLRNQIGLVSQQVLLFNGSVAENIGYSVAGADLEQITEAAKAAHALDFIQKLPHGFDTLIGDQGVRLSGGQKQRLALARVLLKDPPVLILDEATAMFDPKGEQDFIEECHDLLQQCTVILITHRPASLALADRIVHLENGHAQEVASTQHKSMAE